MFVQAPALKGWEALQFVAEAPAHLKGLVSDWQVPGYHLHLANPGGMHALALHFTNMEIKKIMHMFVITSRSVGYASVSRESCKDQIGG